MVAVCGQLFVPVVHTDYKSYIMQLLWPFLLWDIKGAVDQHYSPKMIQSTIYWIQVFQSIQQPQVYNTVMNFPHH